MTAELTSRCVADSRPSRSNHHQQLLHPTKTDEIEILEAGGGGGGIEEHHETKVSSSSIFFFFSYLNTKYIVGSFTLCTACARTLRMEYLDPFCENNFSFDSRRMGIHYIIYIIQATHTQRANSHRASGMDGIRRTWSLYIYLWLAHAVVDNKAHANQFSRMNTALMCAQSIIFHVCVVLLRPFENHISSDRRWNWNSQLSVSFLHSSSSPYPIPHL